MKSRSSAIRVLAEYAALQQIRFESRSTAEERRTFGHFGTSPKIAHFMAGMFEETDQNRIRILDAGAGVGTLTAAVCDRVCQFEGPRHLECELWESNPRLVEFLNNTLTECRRILSDESPHQLSYSIHNSDFLLDERSSSQPANFQLAILNPPWFKLSKNSPQAQTMKHVVHGQPNIYALFMARSAELLEPNGQLVAITPRSYFNGPYFAKLRTWFLDQMSIRRIHLIESRRSAFRKNKVLQENVILFAQRRTTDSAHPMNNTAHTPKHLLLTTSSETDFPEPDTRKPDQSSFPYSDIVRMTRQGPVIQVPGSADEQTAIATIDQLSNNFGELGLRISTGPVVPFRATAFLRSRPSAKTVPLLWMHNVRAYLVNLESRDKKHGHIECSDQSQHLLIPARPMVLLKRFTSREENRRVVAAVFTENSLSTASPAPAQIGLENHLNYITHQTRPLTNDEAFGIAGYLNTLMVDRYIRSVSGSTQINAADIRNLPFPSFATLRQIGKHVQNHLSQTAEELEPYIQRKLSASKQA
ncbi:MAG: Eco57I restriction-modification methylase domain-containing protein [Planctomyces sp.]|nr:Eco57I restriction-modification methylase domain-containing protein [Planctomyces sp.]